MTSFSSQQKMCDCEKQIPGSEYGATEESVLESLFFVALMLTPETSPLRSMSLMTTESETKRLIAQNRL